MNTKGKNFPDLSRGILCRVWAAGVLLLIGMTTAQAKLNVVATTADFGSLAAEIGVERVEVTTLARPMEDPHFVNAKPSFIVKLSRADVLIEGGADLESGWLPALLQKSRNAKIVRGGPGRIDASAGVTMLEVPTELDRSAGDIHAHGNPHYMVDPVNAKIVARHIAEVFSRLDPAGESVFRENLETFSRRLDEKLEEWLELMLPHQGKEVVAYHNSWPYFARRFGLKINLFLEPKPGIPPSPSHLAVVIERMREAGIRVVFADPYLNRKTAETVARATGATVVDVAQFPGGLKGTEQGYIELMEELVREVAEALNHESAVKKE